MRLNLKSMIVTLVAVALLGTGPVLASPTAEPPGAPDKDHSASTLARQASILLVEIQKETAQLGFHADTLGTFAWNPQYSWQSHAFYLDGVKGHINAVGERISELQQIRNAVLPWQQQAIDQVAAHAAQVAASTEAAIAHLRENQDRLFVSEYQDHLTTIANSSEDMKQTVDKFLDYEKAQQKFQQPRNELELAGD